MRVSGTSDGVNSRQNNKRTQSEGHWRGVLAELSDPKHLTLGNKPSLSKRHTYRVLVSFTTSQSNSRRPAQLLTQTFAFNASAPSCCNCCTTLRPTASPSFSLSINRSMSSSRSINVADSGPAVAPDRRTHLRLAQPLAPIQNRPNHRGMYPTAAKGLGRCCCRRGALHLEPAMSILPRHARSTTL